MEGRSDSGEAGFHIYYKKYNIASSFVFDGIGKLKSGIWGPSPTIDDDAEPSCYRLI